MFSKRSLAQKRRREKEKAIDSLGGCLSSGFLIIFELVFKIGLLPFTLIYLGVFKKSVSSRWKLIYKILAFIVWAFIASIVISSEWNEAKQMEETNSIEVKDSIN